MSAARTRKSRPTAPRRALIAALYLSGRSLREIAAEVGLTVGGVSYHVSGLRAEGVIRTGDRRKRPEHGEPLRRRNAARAEARRLIREWVARRRVVHHEQEKK